MLILLLNVHGRQNPANRIVNGDMSAELFLNFVAVSDTPHLTDWVDGLLVCIYIYIFDRLLVCIYIFDGLQLCIIYLLVC